MEEAIELSRAFAQSNCATAITINIVKNSTIDKYYASGEAPRRMPRGRLPLFVPEHDRLQELEDDLSVCESNTDVCRALSKLGGGRIRLEHMAQDFVSALPPYLGFPTTPNAILQAVKRF